jgi:hypothetical protein
MADCELRGLGMRFLFRLVVFLALLVGAFFGTTSYLSEQEEVVVLTTEGPVGDAETRVWVVDHGGYQWLRAGHEGAGWYKQIEANAEVQVERGGAKVAYTAVRDLEMTETINGLMREKYTLADQLISIPFSRDGAIAIRLVPVEEQS